MNKLAIRLMVDLSSGLATCALVVALTTLFGYIFEIQWLTSWGGTQVMAIPTAFAFVLLSIGVMLLAKACRL